MALSNILKEPRREITETVFGAAPVGIFVVADYWFASWLCRGSSTYGYGRDMFVCLVLGVVVTVAFCLGIIAIHAIGDGICNILGKNGMDPRPTKRYR